MVAIFKRSFLAVVVLASLQAVASAADVSVHDVYEAAQAGHVREAQTMMQQVLRDHPNSAKAHYVDAEILAKGGQLAAARAELASAERLEPGLPFATPSAVQALQERLANSAATTRQAGERPQFPWGLALLGIALLVAVVMFVRALRQRSIMQAGPMMQGGGYGQAGYGQPGYGPNMGPLGGGTGGGGMGGGILGGLATGAALGAGMVAGETLAHRFMGDEGHSSSLVPDAQADTLHDASDPNGNMGGADFGVNDSASWDDGSSSWDSGGGGDFGGGDSWS